MENGYSASDSIVRYQVINRQFLVYPTIFGKYINPDNEELREVKWLKQGVFK